MAKKCRFSVSYLGLLYIRKKYVDSSFCRHICSDITAEGWDSSWEFSQNFVIFYMHTHTYLNFPRLHIHKRMLLGQLWYVYLSFTLSIFLRFSVWNTSKILHLKFGGISLRSRHSTKPPRSRGHPWPRYRTPDKDILWNQEEVISKAGVLGGGWLGMETRIF